MNYSNTDIQTFLTDSTRTITNVIDEIIQYQAEMKAILDTYKPEYNPFAPLDYPTEYLDALVDDIKREKLNKIHDNSEELERPNTDRKYDRYGFARSDDPERRSLYRCYANILQRCYNPNNPTYKYYGARGIKCWFTSVQELYDEVGFRPSPRHSIERIDNDGHYEPGNVRWATQAEQLKNRRKPGTIH